MVDNPIRLEAKDILYSPVWQSWQNCWQRARFLILNPAISLTAVFLLVFGVGYWAIERDGVGLIIAAVVALALLLLISFDNLKLWMIIYPLVFIAPRLELGGTSGGGQGFGIQLYEPIILILLCLWIPRLLARRRLDLPSILKIALIVVGLIGLNAVRIAPDRMQGLKYAGRLFYEPLLVFTMIATMTWQRIEVRAAARIFICVAALVAAISIVSSGSRTKGPASNASAAQVAQAEQAQANQTSKGSERLETYWEGTNTLAAFLVAAVPLSIGIVASSSSLIWLGAALGAGLVQLTALVLTFTRGAWLALALALFVMAWQTRSIRWPLVGLLLLLAAAFFAPPELLQRVTSISSFKYHASTANRIHMWHYAVALVAQRPLTGYGFGGFRVLYSNQPGIMSIHAHDFMLDYALAIGIPGLLLILTIFVYVLARAIRTVVRGLGASRDVPLLAGLCTGCIGMLCAGLVDGSIPVWPVLAHSFWFLLALTYVATLAIEHELSTVALEGDYDETA